MPYKVLLKTNAVYDRNKKLPVYVVILSANPFLYYAGTILFFTNVEFKCYKAVSEGDHWEEQGLIVGDGSGTLATVPAGSTYAWCNLDIPEYVDGATNLYTYYPGTPAEEIDGAGMPVGLLSPDGQYTFPQGKTPSPLSCYAASPDGGTISYRWHKLVNKKDGGEVGSGASFYPPTDNLGSMIYYAIITNERNGSRTSGYTADAAVTIVEAAPEESKASKASAMIRGWLIGRRLAAMRRAEGGISVTSRLGEGVLGYMRLGE